MIRKMIMLCSLLLMLSGQAFANQEDASNINKTRDECYKANWETYSDLRDLGKEDQVRKRMAGTSEKIKNQDDAKQAASLISNWWEANKDNPDLKIHWNRAFVNIR
jgi:hypothetical protein